MVEVFHKNSGPVKTACSCTPGKKLTSHLPQSCSSPSGTATALTKTIFAKTHEMPTPYDTLWRFARCMKGKEPCSMRKDKNGWMLPVGVCKLIWCRWCVRGSTQLVTRYGNGPSQLIFHAFWRPTKMCPRYVILTTRITYESSGPSQDLSRGWAQHGNPSKDCGTSKRSAVRSAVGAVRFSGVLRRAQTER